MNQVIKEIEKFLNQPKTSSIFVRPFNLTTILALYDAYFNKFKKITGEKIANVLIHFRKRQFEFFVDFNLYTPKIVKKINAKKKYKLLHQGVEKYYRWVKQFKTFIQKKASLKKAKIFDLAAKIFAFEALAFIVHYIDKDLRIPIKDKSLLKKCERARLETEKFLVPGGELDLFLGSLKYIPSYFRGYKPNQRGEFLVFNKRFIYDKKIISEFKKLKKERFEKNLAQVKEIKGMVAFPGRVKGLAKIILSKADFKKMKKGNILIAHGTTPDYLPVIRMARAIVNEEGGYLSHAAIVSRELKIPCLIGTKIATKVIKDNDLIEVDAKKGVVKILKSGKNFLR
jgi:phosphohistidine swiveling domain-containing protein